MSWFLMNLFVKLSITVITTHIIPAIVYAIYEKRIFYLKQGRLFKDLFF